MKLPNFLVAALIAVSVASPAQSEPGYKLLQRKYTLCVESKVLEDYNFRPPKDEALQMAVRQAQSYCRKYAVAMRLQFTENHALEAYTETMWTVTHRLQRMR